MDIANRVLATTESADLAVKALERTAAGRDPPAQDLFCAIIPVFEIRWSSEVVRRIGSSRINPLIRRLRNSNLPLDRYNRIDSMWKGAISNDVSNFPKPWDGWRSIGERFGMGEVADLIDWLPVGQWFVDQKLHDPRRLDAATQSQLNTLLSGATVASDARKLGRSAAIAFAESPPPAGVLESMMHPRPDADSLLKDVRDAPFSRSDRRNWPRPPVSGEV